MSKTDTLQTRTARTTVQVAGGLFLFKLVSFLITGSSGVLGSTLDSGLDMLASLVVLWAVTAAARPPTLTTRMDMAKPSRLPACSNRF